MKFFLYGMWKDSKENPQEPYDTFIGISAASKQDARQQLIELVGEEKAKQFSLYDIMEN